jgi:drug/metabolite transporter (DMT)-like permease
VIALPLNKKYLGTLFIAIAAMLWATDALFRAPTVQTIDPVFIVLFEHFVGVAVLFLWICLRRQVPLLVSGYSVKTWLSLFVIGAGGSAVATVLFTASFKYVNPSVSILLQKLQPLFVVALAFLFLGERPSKTFWPWALVALLAALGVSLPHLHLTGVFDLQSKGVIYALSAAGIWAVSTVAGKSASHSLPPTVLTFWRYTFGLGALLVLSFLSGSDTTKYVFHPELISGSVLRSLIYIAFIPGIAALVFYYSGLKRAPAITATFTELLFPVSAVALNWFFLGADLNPTQLISGAVLLVAVSQIAIAL